MSVRLHLVATAAAWIAASCSREPSAPPAPTNVVAPATATAATAEQAERPLARVAGIEAQPPEGLAASYAALESAPSDWEAERWAQAADAQLALLAGALERAAEFDDSLLERVFDEEFSSGALRPRSVELRADGAALQAGRTTTAAAERVHQGRAGASDALRTWRAAFGGGDTLALHVDVLRVEPSQDGFTCELALEASSVGARPVRCVAARWRVTWRLRGAAEEPRITAFEVLAHSEAQAAEPLYDDVTQGVLASAPDAARQFGAGREFWARRFDRALGFALEGDDALALADVDGDGREDLYVTQPAGLPNRLLLQQADGTLRDAAREAGVDFLDGSRAALLVDLDNDGDPDLAVDLGQRLALLENDGRGRFAERFSAPLRDTSALCAADGDGDGDVDLYVCASTPVSRALAAPLALHDANNGPANTLLANAIRDGAWSFVDATLVSGLDHNNRRFSSAAAWEDYDSDGDLDLYVANDFGRDNLYRNDGGFFRDVADSAGVDAPSASTGLAWCDFDRDGRMDLVVARRASASGSRLARDERVSAGGGAQLRGELEQFARASGVLRNLGDGRFAPAFECEAPRATNALVVSAADSDGWPDVLALNGCTGADPRELSTLLWRDSLVNAPTHTRRAPRERFDASWAALVRLQREGASWGARERNTLELNTRDGRALALGAVSGLNFAGDASSAARVDWDRDGDEDLWIVGRGAPRLRLMRNRRSAPGETLSVLLEATRGARDALGARVEVTLEGQPPLIASVRAGDGSRSQSSRWLHFALGASATVERVVVHWPRLQDEAAVQSEPFDALAAGGRYVLRQGTGRAAAVERQPVTLAPGALPSRPESERVRCVFAARPPLPPAPLLVPDSDTPADLRDNTPRPLLITLWSSACEDCVAELAQLTRRAPELNTSGLELLALSCDELAARPAALEVLQRVQWEQRAAFANTATLDTLDVLQRGARASAGALSLPTSFLIDHEGALAVLYVGPIELDTLVADAARLRSSAAERRAAATPFAGRWDAAPPATPKLAELQLAYSERGLLQAEQAAAEALAAASKSGPERVLIEMGATLARQGRLEEATQRFAAAVEAAPEQFDGHFNLAAAQHELRDLQAAIASYKRALACAPNHAGALYNLALARAAIGDLASAQSDLRQLELLDPAAASKLREQLDTLFKR
jgi:tetratricopeptide (TPR) repeat protein